MTGSSGMHGGGGGGVNGIKLENPAAVAAAAFRLAAGLVAALCGWRRGGRGRWLRGFRPAVAEQ